MDSPLILRLRAKVLAEYLLMALGGLIVFAFSWPQNDVMAFAALSGSLIAVGVVVYLACQRVVLTRNEICEGWKVGPSFHTVRSLSLGKEIEVLRHPRYIEFRGSGGIIKVPDDYANYEALIERVERARITSYQYSP